MQRHTVTAVATVVVVAATATTAAALDMFMSTPTTNHRR